MTREEIHDLYIFDWGSPLNKSNLRMQKCNVFKKIKIMVKTHYIKLKACSGWKDVNWLQKSLFNLFSISQPFFTRYSVWVYYWRYFIYNTKTPWESSTFGNFRRYARLITNIRNQKIFYPPICCFFQATFKVSSLKKTLLFISQPERVADL